MKYAVGVNRRLRLGVMAFVSAMSVAGVLHAQQPADTRPPSCSWSAPAAAPLASESPTPAGLPAAGAMGHLLFDENGGHGMLFTSFEGQLMMALHAPNDRDARPRMFEMQDTGETLAVMREFTHAATTQPDAR